MNSQPPDTRYLERQRTQFQSAPPAPQDDGDIDLSQVFSVLWRGKLLIIAYVILAIVLGGYYAFSVATPYYRSTAWLVLSVQSSPVVDIDSVVSGVSTESEAINTEIDILTSRELLVQLIDEMDLTEDPEFNARIRPEGWLSRSKIEALIAPYAEQYAPFLLSEDKAPTAQEVQIKVAETLREAITVTAKDDTYLYSINVRTTDPEKSAEIANRLAAIYIRDQVGIKLAATEFATEWLAERVTELEIEVKEGEDAIKDLRGETELTSPAALEALNIRAKDLRQRVEVTRATLETVTGRIEAVDQQVTAGNAAEAAALLQDTRLERLVPEAGTGPGVPQAFWDRVATLQDAARIEQSRLAIQLDVLEKSMVEINAQIDEQNADFITLNQLVRESEATKILYETFLTRLKETSVQIGLVQADSRVMSAAVAGREVAPRKSLILMISLALAFALAAATLLGRQFVRSGFRTYEELEQATGYAVIGQVPMIPKSRRKQVFKYLRENPTSAAAEAVRNLRTSVFLSGIAGPPQIIMSTSSLPGEGKTTQSIALAQNVANMGKSVLLIEGDIRRRVMADYFKSTAPGNLITAFEEKHTLIESITKDVVEGLDLMVGGATRQNPADIFSSPRFQDMLDEMRTLYDFVVIDTPPVLVVPDARIIGRLVDTSIYSVKWDSTSKVQVAAGLKELRLVEVNLSGLVLSQIDPKGMKRYGYGGSYGAYGDYGKPYYNN